jgi:succinate dehydrogenase / fumarate reductase flavoprotein subunit
LLTRDVVARAIAQEVREGRGSPHGGAFLDIATRRKSDEIRRKLPGMYQQFQELADVDITKEPMEVGPTCHYVMGGVEVDPDTQAAVGVQGLFAAGEVSGGMHGSNRLGGNSLSDLLVFGRRAGLGAAQYVDSLGGTPPVASDATLDAAAKAAVKPFEGDGTENPYSIHQELQQTMNDLVGIIRTADEVAEAVAKLEVLRERSKNITVEGHRQFNPGWHLAIDLRNMLLISEAVAKAALIREESRGGHTREDFPGMRPDWRQVNLVCKAVSGDGSFDITVQKQPLPVMPTELLSLFDKSELKKYMTEAELTALPEGDA